MLKDKYNFKPKDLDQLNDFISKMIQWEPQKRATAQELLNHPFLGGAPKPSNEEEDIFVTDSEDSENEGN